MKTIEQKARERAREADDIAARVLTDLELVGIRIQPDEQWQEVKWRIVAALLAWGKEQREEMVEEAAKTSKEAHYIYCEVSNRYPSEGLAEFQVQCIQRLKEE